MSNELELIPARDIDDAVLQAETRAYHRLKNEYLGDRQQWVSEDTEEVRHLLQILQISRQMGQYEFTAHR